MQFGRDLRGYGVGTLMKLHQAGTLHATVQCKTRLPELPAPPASWTSLEIPSVIALSVLRSVDPFMESAVLEGGWDPGRGAQVKTYFLGRCDYALPLACMTRGATPTERVALLQTYLGATTGPGNAADASTTPEPTPTPIPRARRSAVADRTAHRDAATSTGYSATTNIRGYQHHPAEALRALDAELAATVERLQRARVELGLILRNHAPTDLLTDFASAAGAAGLSEADRSLMIVMSRVMGPKRLEAYAEMLRNVPTDPTDGEFDALPADADDEARQGLAERMAPHIHRIQAENRAVAAPDSDAPRGKRFVSEIAAAAMRELYTQAQLDVFRRVQALLRAEPPVGYRDERA